MATTETRHTDWIVCEDGPWACDLDHGGFAAYRIWVRTDGLSWFQRHEWRHADGTTETDEWIQSPLRSFGSADLFAAAA